MPQLGRVAIGQTADLVMIDITGPLASTHPVPALTLHARVDDVTTVIVDGDIVVEDRQLLAIDGAKILDEAHAALRVIASRTQ